MTVIKWVAAVCIVAVVFAGNAMGEEGAGVAPPAKNEDREQEWILFQEARQAISEYLSANEVLVPLDILAKSEIGDHFETINPDRADKQNAYGNPDARVFTSIMGNATDGAEFETYGERGGGGRRLMVPKRNAELSQAIMKCMKEGLDKKLQPALSVAQQKELDNALHSLGGDDYTERENASKAIIALGAGCIATMEETLKTNHDAEVAARIKRLLPKLKLLAVLAQFKAEHPLSATAKGEKVKGTAGKADSDK